MKTLEMFLKKFSVDGDTPVAAAKTWACLEALVKAKGSVFKVSQLRIKFPFNSAPQIEDPDNVLKGKYHLTLSHEAGLVVAVALRIGD